MNQQSLLTPLFAIHSLFEYKAWANTELFAAVAAIDSVSHRSEVHNAIRILNHIYVVDCIFKAQLQGASHGYSATNTNETPSLPALADAVKAVDAWYAAYTLGLTRSSLEERLHFTFTDGDAGSMTREEILLHVVTHGGYHRGTVGQIMRSVSAAPPRDLYTRYLHAADPGRRSGIGVPPKVDLRGGEMP
jgi:uncharacterized damage-inducible protein DinB